MSMPEPLIPDRELPGATTGDIATTQLSGFAEPRGRLQNSAERVGSAAGNVVDQVRHLPNRVQDLKRRFTVIRGRGKADLKEQAREKAEELREEATVQVERARMRIEVLVRERPMQVIAGAAVMGIILGISLRLWRDHA